MGYQTFQDGLRRWSAGEPKTRLFEASRRGLSAKGAEIDLVRETLPPDGGARVLHVCASAAGTAWTMR